jgi:hypothetical protein
LRGRATNKKSGGRPKVSERQECTPRAGSGETPSGRVQVWSHRQQPGLGQGSVASKPRPACAGLLRLLSPGQSCRMMGRTSFRNTSSSSLGISPATSPAGKDTGERGGLEGEGGEGTGPRNEWQRQRSLCKEMPNAGVCRWNDGDGQRQQQPARAPPPRPPSPPPPHTHTHKYTHKHTHTHTCHQQLVDVF